MILAAIDLGSNTLKMTVADVTADGRFEVLFEDAEITRISEGRTERGELSEHAIERTFEKLREFVVRARALSAEKIGAVATAGLRGAPNAGAFLDRVRNELSLDVELISGEREAELCFSAAIASFGPGPIVVFDPGGRSSEIIVGDAHAIASKVSLEVGGVFLTEKFLKHDPPLPSELSACRAHVREVFKTAPPASANAALVGVSGTVVSLLGLQLGISDVETLIEVGEGEPLFREKVEAIYAELSSKRTEERLFGSVVPKGRADVIVAGAILVLTFMEHYSRASLFSSNRGVRYGLLAEMAHNGCL